MTGKKEETLSFPEDQGVTISAILLSLAKSYGKEFDQYVFAPKTHEVKRFLQFFINGKSVSTLRELQTSLNDGDMLAIVPPVGGG
jgi:MoaD family protein